MKKNVKVAYDAIKKKILSCKYQPGQLVSEKDIVQKLNISRTPVREAVNILKGEGILDIIPNRGIQISSLSTRKMKEIYDIRMIIEPFLVRQAINMIKPDDIEYLTKLHEKLIACVNNKEASEIFETGMDIHLHIAHLSDNEVLFDIIKMLRDESHRGYVYYLQSFFDYASDEEDKAIMEDILNTVLDRHNKLLKSLIEKDEESAVNFMIDELTYARKLFTKNNFL